MTLQDPQPDGLAEGAVPFPVVSQPDRARIALRQKRDHALRAPGTTLQPMPGINALSFTVRYLPGGRTRFLEFVKLAAQNGDAVATAWWMVFADLTPTDRNRCSFDDVCAAAGVKPSALLAGVVGHGMEAMTDMGNLVAAALHPEVIAAMGKSALKMESEIGAGDRLAFLQARGFVPVAKGAAIHVHANASANSQAASASSAEPSVPKFAADIASLSESRAQVQRQIADAAPGLDVIDAETAQKEANP